MQQLQDLDFFGYNNYGPWIGLFQDSSDPLFSEPSGGWRWDDGSSLNYFERQQAKSSYLKGESAPGRVFRLGHGINNIQSTHRRVFFTVLAVESGKTNIKLSELGQVGNMSSVTLKITRLIPSEIIHSPSKSTRHTHSH